MNKTNINSLVGGLGIAMAAWATATQSGAGPAPVVIDRTPTGLRDIVPRLWTAVYSPDGQTLATTAGWDDPREPGELVLWDVATGQTKLIWRQEATIRTAVFSGDGK